MKLLFFLILTDLKDSCFLKEQNIRLVSGKLSLTHGGKMILKWVMWRRARRLVLYLDFYNWIH